MQSGGSAVGRGVSLAGALAFRRLSRHFAEHLPKNPENSDFLWGQYARLDGPTGARR